MKFIRQKEEGSLLTRSTAAICARILPAQNDFLFASQPRNKGRSRQTGSACARTATTTPEPAPQISRGEDTAHRTPSAEESMSHGINRNTETRSCTFKVFQGDQGGLNTDDNVGKRHIGSFLSFHFATNKEEPINYSFSGSAAVKRPHLGTQ